MQKKKIFLLLLIFLIVVVFVTLEWFSHYKIPDMGEESFPTLKLKGYKNITLDLGDKYIEPGYKATDETDGNITKKVKVTDNINLNTPGVYEVVYTVTNSGGNKASVKRKVDIRLSYEAIYKGTYNSIDNTVYGWGTNNKENGKRPNTDLSNTELKKYNAYAMGSDEKVLYLTFDEGSDESYLPEIVEVLNKNDVKATFFLCQKYIENHPKLIKQMVKNGHSIGNHTSNHDSMSSYATKENFSKYLSELIELEKTYKKITGKNMEHIYREPSGNYSLRTLTILKDLGYKTYFWSAAYQDWDNKLTKEEALKEMIKHVHNGAIFLIHPVSKGNYLALDSFIEMMKSQGYKFDLVKNIN